MQYSPCGKKKIGIFFYLLLKTCLISSKLILPWIFKDNVDKTP